jgi:MFS family permease
MFLVGAAFFAMWYFLSLYLQNVLGYSALRAGMAFLPMAVAIIIGAQVSSRLMPRTGTRPLLLAGTLLATAGFAWLSRIAPGASYWQHVFGPGCLIALALGLLFTPLAAAATAGVPLSEAGLASGVLNTSRQIGGSLGLAVLATIATDRTKAILAGAAGGHAGAAGPGAQPSAAVAAALNGGYARAFGVAAALTLAAFLASFVVPAIRNRRSPPGETGDQATEQRAGARDAAHL